LEQWEQRLGRVLNALRLNSIKNKILVLALLATFVPALSTAVLFYVQNREALTQTLDGELQGIGSQAARELDLWVKQRFYDVRVFVNSFEVTENLERISRGGPGAVDASDRLTNYLTGVRVRFDDYAEFLVIDTEGRPVASSSTDLRDLDVPAARMDRLRRGQPVLGEPSWDESLGAVVTTVAHPIQSADAGFLGGLVATLTFDAPRVILVRFAPGADGRVDLLTADGLTIVASSPSPPLEPAISAEFRAQLAEAAGRTIEYASGEESSVVAVLTPVPGLDWNLVTRLPSSEAYAHVTQLRNSTIGLVSALLGSIGLAAYFLGLFIVRPLDRLTAGADAVAEGDLSVDLPVTGRDEVGSLTVVFNGMVARLRRSREELDEANRVLREQNAELERLSVTDALTGLRNRRYVMEALDKEIRRAARHKRSLAVLMMDLDRFKEYNDNHGHVAGDEVLRGMGAAIEHATRGQDVPARYGGEEFIAVLPDCEVDGAIATAGRIRERLAEGSFKGGAVTVSIGVAVFPADGDAATALVESADAALYRAKEEGRDRVILASEDAGAEPAPKKKPANKTTPKDDP